jgi:hypothetical protein
LSLLSKRNLKIQDRVKTALVEYWAGFGDLSDSIPGFEYLKIVLSSYVHLKALVAI